MRSSCAETPCLGPVRPADASRAPTEEELEHHIDLERRRKRLDEAIDALGERGRVLSLRYFEHLEWDAVASGLGVSVATARREHDAALRLLASRLVR